MSEGGTALNREIDGRILMSEKKGRSNCPPVPRGYAYLPKIVREEVGVEGKGEIPFFINANCVLLIRKEATKQEILRGLEILKADLKLR